jgi:CheY-like chemotaxis protein
VRARRSNEVMQLEILARSADLDRANRELRDANARLGELDRAKTAFFSNVSHELRTPLQLMLGPVEDALEVRDLSPAMRARLELLHRNALRLQKLVDALLDFARLEAGRLEPRPRPTDLAALTGELASVFRAAAEQAGLDLEVDCALAEPVVVDPDLWERVVLNLMSNAFKFTFEGRIAVRLREDGAGIELVVADTGQGIPPDQVARVFERFHRVPGVRSRTHEGAGIGLAFVREIVELHGGTVAVTSEVGRGSTFTVRMPRTVGAAATDGAVSARASSRAAAAAELDAWTRPPDPSAARTGAPRILVADDNADLRAYVRGILRDYDVECVPDGVAALKAIRRERPDLVLSDVMMPWVDGHGLVRELKADPDLRDIPVVLLSARAGEGIEEGLELGADDYVTKPFSSAELRARVRTHLRRVARLRGGQ